jgi:hypothetical protein
MTSDHLEHDDARTVRAGLQVGDAHWATLGKVSSRLEIRMFELT